MSRRIRTSYDTYRESVVAFCAMEEHSPPDVANATNDSGVETVPGAEPLSSSSRQRSPLAFGLLALGALLVLVLGLQLYTVFQASETRSDVTALGCSVGNLTSEVASLEGSVASMSDRVASVEETQGLLVAAARASQVAGQSPAPALPAGYLPRFEAGQTDTALGRIMPAVEGLEYYTNTVLNVDPADGTNRLWLIWAHWCPHCQAELPPLSAWYVEKGDRYTAELITVTTSIDASRDNPLQPYLDESQFPFPVLVDVSSDLAARFGVSAFPFWVITDGEGRVLFRSAGRLETNNVEAIFEQLESLES